MTLLLQAECKQHILFKYFHFLINFLCSLTLTCIPGTSLVLPRYRGTAAGTFLLQLKPGPLHLPYYKPQNFIFSQTYQKKLNTNSSCVTTQVTFACWSCFRFWPAFGQIMVCDMVSLLVGSKRPFLRHFPASVREAKHSRVMSHSLELPFILALCWAMSHLISFNIFQVAFSYIEIHQKVQWDPTDAEVRANQWSNCT